VHVRQGQRGNKLPFLLLMSRYLIDIPPALHESLADAVHPGLGAVVRMVDILQHLLRVATVAGREWLVPLREDVRFRFREGVLSQATEAQFLHDSGAEKSGTYSRHLVELALDREAEVVQI
jgi:hypothetical protein